MSNATEQHGQLDTGYPHTLRPELHKALKARGINYWIAQGITFWNRDDGCECLAYGYRPPNGVSKLTIKVVGLTEPEQAIEATLGPRTCHNEAAPNCRDYWFCCSECEFVAHTNKTVINYCPNCGRKVVDE